MAKGNDRPVAVFHWKKYRPISSFLIKVGGLIKNIEDKPALYPGSASMIATAKINLKALVVAQTRAGTRIRGGASTRNLKYDKVRKDVLTIQGYVQALADAGNVEKAVVIITSSGLSVKKKPARTKVPFAVKQGKGAGTVRLIAQAAAKRASYNWQMSLDGVRWTDLPITIKANTIVSGLTEGKKYFFRYRSITKEGERGWSNVLHIFVQ